MTVEWLDGEDADELPPPPRLPPGRRHALWIVGVALVVIVAVAVGVSRAGSGSPHGARPPTAAVSSSSSTHAVPALSVPPAPTSADSSTAAKAPTVTGVGHRILAATSNWELFARTDSGILRIEMAAGRIHRTPMPGLDSNGGISFVVGPTSAVVRPYDAVAGYVVRDGEAPRTLTGLLARAGAVYAGPTPDEVWVQPDSTGSSTPAPRLYDLRQESAVSTGPSAPQEFGAPFTADGSGHLLYGAVDGIYDVRPDGVHRVTTGALTAVGSTRWLVQECDDRFRCSDVLIDQASGVRRVLGPAHANVNYEPGSISPDGRWAAFASVRNGGGSPSIHLVDLQSGTDTDLGLSPSDTGYGANPFVWDPDNGALLFVDDTQHVRVLDPATRRSVVLDLSLPPVDQIALRPAGG